MSFIAFTNLSKLAAVTSNLFPKPVTKSKELFSVSSLPFLQEIWLGTFCPSLFLRTAGWERSVHLRIYLQNDVVKGEEFHRRDSDTKSDLPIRRISIDPGGGQRQSNAKEPVWSRSIPFLSGLLKRRSRVAYCPFLCVFF